MPDTQEFSMTAFRPEAAMTAAQRGVAYWSRAWTQVTNGMLNVSAAQAELARTICTLAPEDWDWIARTGTPPEPGPHPIERAKSKFETVLKSYRRTNDELAATFFSAATTLMEVMRTAGTPERTEPAIAELAEAKPPVTHMTKRSA